MSPYFSAPLVGNPLASPRDPNRWGLWVVLAALAISLIAIYWPWRRESPRYEATGSVVLTKAGEQALQRVFDLDTARARAEHRAALLTARRSQPLRHATQQLHYATHHVQPHYQVRQLAAASPDSIRALADSLHERLANYRY